MEWRTLTAEDTSDWSKLADEVAAADDTGEHYAPDALAEELAAPGAAGLGVFEDGALIAAGQVPPVEETYDGEITAYFLGAVHPRARGCGIGGTLFDRLEALAVDAARARYPGRAFHSHTHAFDGVASARALAESRGYEPVRYFHQMEAVPRSGFRSPRLQRYRPELDAEVLDAHRVAFAGHWGSAPPSPDSWRRTYTGSTRFRAEFSTVAATIDGRVDGYLLAFQDEDAAVRIGDLGVRPEVRGRGLGRKLLEATLAEIAAAGIPRATLYVDSENAHYAGQLYESVGFSRRRTVIEYRRRDPVGGATR